MSTGEPFGGALVLRPGLPRPHNLRSTRPDWLGRATAGLPADRLPALLGNVFSLCGHAHRLCAGMAVAAARGEVPSLDAAALARETLREHLRRIWLDWPRLLGGAEADLAELARCPAEGDPRPWLAAAVFGMAPADWLRAWCDAPAEALARWSAAFDTLPARLLRGCRAVASFPIEAAAPLRVADAAGDAPRETGTWTRLRGTDATPATAWLRLGSRLADVARLALREPVLDAGATSTAPGEAIAWVEMARGLLVHELRLDGDGRVASCRVRAPTDRNFDAHGPVARALETLAAADAAQIGALVAAYDPCVPYRIETEPSPEAAHA